MLPFVGSAAQVALAGLACEEAHHPWVPFDQVMAAVGFVAARLVVVGMLCALNVRRGCRPVVR